MQQQLTKDVHNAITELAEMFASIDENLVNVVPFDGSWTAAQLVQHMIISNGGFLETITGTVEDTARVPDQKVEDIRDTFLNFSVKLQAPEFVRPALIDYDKNTLVESLFSIRNGLDYALEVLDLTKTCTSFKLPALGYLTRLEAAHFILYHTQRHIVQLNRIVARLPKDVNVAVN